MHPSGTIAPMPTPTDDHGGVATEELAEYAELLAAELDGLFPCGSIGEFPSLTREQRHAVVETVCDAVDVPVLAGCGATSVADVRGYIEHAADAGADAAVVPSPYYLGAPQGGLRRFFRAVANDAPLPLVLYNIPARTGVSLSIETITALADHDRIVGLKDSTRDVAHVQAVIEATPEEFAVLQGGTDVALASLDVGADGMVAGPADVFPRALAELHDAARRGDRERAATVAARVAIPMVGSMAAVPTASAIKHFLARRGFDAGDPLPPLAPLDAATRDRLDDRFDALRRATVDLGLERRH